MGASNLGGLLVAEGLLSERDRRTIRDTSGFKAAAFAKGVLALGLLDEDELAAFIAERTNLELAPKDALPATAPDVIGALDIPLLTRLEVLPLERNGGVMSVAMADPLDKETIRQLEFFTGYKIRPVIATFSQIQAGLKRLAPGFSAAVSELEEFIGNHAEAAVRRMQRASPVKTKAKHADRPPPVKERPKAKEQPKALEQSPSVDLDDLIDSASALEAAAPAMELAEATSDITGLDDLSAIGPADEATEAAFEQSLGGAEDSPPVAASPSSPESAAAPSDAALPDISDNALPDISDNALPDISDNALPDISDNALPDISDNALPDISDNAVAPESEDVSSDEATSIAAEGEAMLDELASSDFSDVEKDLASGKGELADGAAPPTPDTLLEADPANDPVLADLAALDETVADDFAAKTDEDLSLPPEDTKTSAEPASDIVSTAARPGLSAAQLIATLNKAQVSLTLCSSPRGACEIAAKAFASSGFERGLLLTATGNDVLVVTTWKKKNSGIDVAYGDEIHVEPLDASTRDAVFGLAEGELRHAANASFAQALMDFAASRELNANGATVVAASARKKEAIRLVMLAGLDSRFEGDGGLTQGALELLKMLARKID